MITTYSLSRLSLFLILCMIVPFCISGTTALQKTDLYSKDTLGQSNPNANQGNSLLGTTEHASDRLIVKYNTQSLQAKSDMMSAQSTANAESKSTVIQDLATEGIPGMQVVQVTGTTLDNAMKVYENNPDVLYVEPDYLISLSPIEEAGNVPDNRNTQQYMSIQAATTSYPNDPDFQNLWGLRNTGQSPFYGTSGSDIHASSAWKATTGSPGVTVAVIDTGVDYSHPDLAPVIWANPAETVNGIDDDKNGYIDDTRGWNFVSKNNNPMDDHGHGTHCAGTIGAVGNNGIGVAGVTWKCRIMPLKFLNSQGNGYTSDAISAILYANKMGVPIISNSWGGFQSQSLRDAIEASSAVVICAAGNSGANSDTNPVYPAAYPSNTIISVAATDYNDKLASFSNYGTTSVDLAAPGVRIYSTAPGAGYKYMNGTSMATPFVSGVAALIKSQNPSLTNSQIKSRILDYSDTLPSLTGKIANGRRLNAARALGVSESTPTPTPSPTKTPTPPPTPLPTPTVTKTPTKTPTASPTPTVTKPPTQPPTPYPTPTITKTPTKPPTSVPTPPVTKPPTPFPTPTASNTCGVLKTDIKNGFLGQGQAVVYGYSIPKDGRSKIEWVIDSYSSNNIIGNNKKSTTPAFDLYVCENCNPKYSLCYAKYSSQYPNNYVSITPPKAGSSYYLMIYARKGSGSFTLKANSYQCSGVASMQSVSQGQNTYSVFGKDTSLNPGVQVPWAQFV